MASEKDNKPSELEKTIERILEFIESGLKEGAEFVQEQVPLLVQELLNYYMVLHGMYALLGIALLYFGYRLTKYCIVRASDAFYTYREEHGIAGLHTGDYPMPLYMAIGPVSVLIGGLTFICNLVSFIKLMVAPRLYLLDYAREIIQGGGCG